jgi:tRNA(Ile)-lysidine synthetase-like protein
VTASQLGARWFRSCLVRDFGELHTPTRIAVALSGGADSTALAHMAASWAEEQPQQRSMVAFHVDHNVRDNSAAEQAHVLDLVKRRHIEAHALTIKWPNGEKPTGGKLQLACRQQRYSLLDAAARKHGADTILVGHHLNDQAETLLLRVSRSTGLRGLSAMRAVVPLVDFGAPPALAIWRPSLDIRKRELVEYCKLHNLDWIHDPSNDNFHFRRVYARRLVETLENEFDCPPEDFAATARVADTLNQVLEHAATEFLEVYGYDRNALYSHRRSHHDDHSTADLVKSTNKPVTTCVDSDVFMSIPSQIAVRVLNRFDVNLSTGGALAFLRTLRDRRTRFAQRISTEMIVPLNDNFEVRFTKQRREHRHKRRAVRVTAPRNVSRAEY